MIKLLQARGKQLTPIIDIFSIIVFLNFFAVFIYKDLSTPEPFFLKIRFWGALLCFILFLLKYLPDNKQIFRYCLWYITIIFCLPLYGTFLFLDNQQSLIWQSKIIIGLMWLVCITNWIEFIITLIIGLILGTTYYKYLHPSFSLREINFNNGIIYNYVWSIFVAMIFIHRKDEMTAVLISSQKKLKELYDKVTSLNQSLEKKVSARTQDLQNALEVKDRFLRNMSHEIRIPLHGILNLSSIVNEQWDNISDSKKRDLIKQLDNNSYRLMNLVSNLLDMSKISQGKLVLQKEKNNITQLTKEVIEEFITTLQNKKTKIDFLQKDPITCICDKEKISQVIRNFISNAIKYGNGNNIKINIHHKKHHIQFLITDQGVGIPHDELKQIFKQFKESSRTRTTAGGTGLGLAICKEIIEAHNGKIEAKNNKKGATFSFELPTTDKAPKKTTNNQKQTALIIDDEEIVLTSTALNLELLGYNAICAQSGLEALEVLKTNTPDVILLDIMMPGMNGKFLLEKIKKDKKLHNIPVIVQTGFPNAPELKVMQKLGIHGPLKKPYNKDELKLELSKVQKQKI